MSKMVAGMIGLAVGLAIGYLIADYMCKSAMDTQGVKKTFGIFQG